MIDLKPRWQAEHDALSARLSGLPTITHPSARKLTERYERLVRIGLDMDWITAEEAKV